MKYNADFKYVVFNSFNAKIAIIRRILNYIIIETPVKAGDINYKVYKKVILAREYMLPRKG